MRIAIIPARSGSKGLVDKNIKPLEGRPLMAYTIEAAINSKCFDEVFVSTDSCNYADIAVEYGASVPFLREDSLASDTAGSWDVVKSVLSQYNQLGRCFDTAALLQPTSPLRTSADIISAFSIFEQNHADSVVSVCEVDHSPLWCNTLPENLSLGEFINDEIKNLSRQQLPTYYRINGAIYIVNTAFLFSNTDIYSKNSFAYIMLKSHSVDIDDMIDFTIAEALMGGNING